MRILVTGANGYIGKWVVKSMLEQGHFVIGIDIKEPDEYLERLEWITGDVLNLKEYVFSDLSNIDGVVHLAWQNGFKHDDNSHLQNIYLHYKLIEKFAQMGCRNITGMGTMHEIGYYEGCVDENTPCNPRSLYGIAKNAFRETFFMLSEKYNFKAKWLRAYYIFGDEEKGQSIFAKIYKWEKEGKTSFPFTSGLNKCDFISVQELGIQIAKAALQDKVTGIINVCSGKPVQLKEKVELFLKEHNYSIRPEYGKYPERTYDSPAIWGDITKIQRIMYM